MSDFTKGVMVTIAVAAFGKGIYELGRLKEQSDDTKRCRALAITLDELSKKTKIN